MRLGTTGTFIDTSAEFVGILSDHFDLPPVAIIGGALAVTAILLYVIL